MLNFGAKIIHFCEPFPCCVAKDQVTFLKLKQIFLWNIPHLQELGKDKWLCPLSGKKFKGPDFVRKHIFNKHGEKIEEVKKEVSW